MKKLFILLFGSFVLFACGNDLEKKAGEKLALAQAAFERGDYVQAKQLIDSIKILYPKAFEARKASQKLMEQVVIKGQGQIIASLDSALQSKQSELAAIVGKYTFEKDTAYQTEGSYLWPTQVIEKNMHRNYLRFQVSEQGVLSMTSIYCGKGNIHHYAIQVSAPDGTTAKTQATKDSYETSDLGEKIEKADYKIGEDGGVFDFINANKDKNIRVEYIGDKKFVTTMSPSDREALVRTSELSKILSEITRIKKELEEANLKVQFVKKKIEYDKKKKVEE